MCLHCKIFGDEVSSIKKVQDSMMNKIKENQELSSKPLIFKNTIEGSPVLSPQYIKNSVLPEEIKKFMIKYLPWK